MLANEPPGGRSVFHFIVDVDDDAADDTVADDSVGIQLTLDKQKVSAIAVTGAPSNLPINVVLPSNCANDAVSDNVAMFPQLFVLDMIDDDDNTTSNGTDDGEAGSAVLVLVLDIIRHFTFVGCNAMHGRLDT